MSKPKNHAKSTSTATIGYEAQLWQMADALRGSMDAAEKSDGCVGSLFEVYMPDSFKKRVPC